MEQYCSCSCDVSPYNCEDDAKRAINPCLETGNVISIINPPGVLSAINAFKPGTTYYLAGIKLSLHPSVLYGIVNGKI